MVGSVPPVCSTGSVSISASSATTLTWSQAITAGSVAAGAIFSSQPVLLLQDANGNSVSSTVVSLDIFTDPSCNTVAAAVGSSGNTSTTDLNGLATFLGLNHANPTPSA